MINLKHNKKGKLIGVPVVSFTFTFSTAMDQGSVTNFNNYQVDWVSTKKVKKKLETVLHKVAIKTATYNASNNSVTLVTNATKATFPKGGELTVVGLPPGGVESAAGVFPAAGTSVFTISPRASRIAP